MKTAKEMLEYVKTNKYSNGWNDKWDLKHFSIIEKTLLPDEYAEVCFIALLTKHSGHFAFAITNKRIILAQCKVVGENLKIVNLNDLNNITLQKSLLSDSITFDTYKEVFNVDVTSTNANELFKKLNNYITFEKKNKEKTSTTSNLDEIKKLKELLDENIITREEFEAKKKQLLGLDK